MTCSKNYAFQLSNGAIGEIGNLTNDTYGNMLEDKKQKNGFVFTVHNFTSMTDTFLKIQGKCKELILQIDNELANEQLN